MKSEAMFRDLLASAEFYTIRLLFPEDLINIILNKDLFLFFKASSQAVIIN